MVSSILFLPVLVPGQPLNFKAEPESETSILLSWTPPRSDTIASYELVYRDGEQGEEVRLIKKKKKTRNLTKNPNGYLEI